MTSTVLDPVWEILNRNLFFIKNAVKRSEFKTSDKFDVCDPANGAVLIESREPELGHFTKFRRFLGGNYDRNAPFDFIATMPSEGSQVLRIAHGGRRTFRNPTVNFYDHTNQRILTLHKRILTFGHKFRITTPQGNPLFQLEVKSMFNGFRFLVEKKELGRISLRWKGEHAETFKTQKFRCALSISEDVPPNKIIRQMLLAVTLSFTRVMQVKARW
jgi:hypothetical protein